jgi:type IV pilus assembly protein PilM
VDADVLVEALRELWRVGRFGTRAVALGIANTGVLVRQMDLDWMQPQDFRQALRYQVEGALPMPVDDANLDYHLIEELELVEGDQTRKVARILLVAAAREMVDGLVGACRLAGLRTTSVDISPFALVRARAFGAVEAPAPVEAIVDIGADTVTVVIHAGGSPRYVRLIPGLGGESVTEAVRQCYDWTWEEAERTKVCVGLPGHASVAPDLLAGLARPVLGLDHPAQQVVADAVAGLVDEIGTTLDHYRGAAGPPSDPASPHEVARVLLTGMGARLGGLAQLLQARLDQPVELLDVRGQIRTPHRLEIDDEDASALAIAAGLCVAAR